MYQLCTCILTLFEHYLKWYFVGDVLLCYFDIFRLCFVFKGVLQNTDNLEIDFKGRYRQILPKLCYWSGKSRFFFILFPPTSGTVKFDTLVRLGHYYTCNVLYIVVTLWTWLEKESQSFVRITTHSIRNYQKHRCERFHRGKIDLPDIIYLK